MLVQVTYIFVYSSQEGYCTIAQSISILIVKAFTIFYSYHPALPFGGYTGINEMARAHLL
jgi:hypothetical protein